MTGVQTLSKEGRSRSWRGEAFNLTVEEAEASKKWWQVPFWFIQFQSYHYLILVLHIAIYLLVLL